MKKIIIILIILITLFIVGLSILLNNNKIENITKKDDKIKIVTTIFPYYDIAKEIGKEKVEVSSLLLPGTEAHSFEPKTSDFIKVNNSDIFIYTGEVMEPWGEKIINSIDKKIIAIKTSEGLELLENQDKHEEDEQKNEEYGFDPHIWLDFENVKKIAEKITDTMIILSPENEKYFTENKNNYIEELINLDNDFKKYLSNCDNKEIIYTGHYAFAYLAKRYDLKHSAIVGISHDTEPTINSLISIIEKIKRENIKYIFYEELSNPKIAEVIKEETGSEMLSLNPLENLSKEDFYNEVSFIEIMENNLANLKKGLNCK